MSVTVLIILARTLWRDRVGLLMMFLLPAAIFMVFAEIFSATAQDTPDMKVGILSLADSPSMERVIDSVALEHRRDYSSEDALLLALASGVIDAGLIIEGDQHTPEAGAMRVLTDPSRPLAGAVLQRQLAENFARAAPSEFFARERQVWTALVGDLTTEQARRLDAVVRGERQVRLPPRLVQTEIGANPRGADPAVSYYAGAIAIMFILFSAMNGASGLIDERNSGVFDRYLAFGRGIGFAIWGRAYFLVSLGFLQMLAVFAVALWVYEVRWIEVPLAWTVITFVSVVCVASIALLFAAVCTTRAQMQTLSTFVVLVMSALGGSMVPLYLMPGWLRWVGGFTPSAWSIELFDGVVTRGLSLFDLMTPLLLLVAVAVLSFSAAILLTQRKLIQ